MKIIRYGRSPFIRESWATGKCDKVKIIQLMISFLFWNINRNSIQQSIVRLARRYEIDVLMLAECQIEPGILLRALNEEGRFGYHYSPKIACEKIELFTQFSREFVQPIYESSRLTIRHLKLPGLTDILLAITHFPSKLHWSESSQAMECVKLSDSIKEAERKVGHTKTVLVGDLNMNPFEDGVVSANGLHGVMSRSIAKKGTRVVQRREYPFFYNPMWGLLGDGTPGPSGTYHYRSAEHVAFFWNMFDQVLIRPDLLPSFDNKGLEIPESDGEVSFLSSKGLPDANVASDHLPVVFGLEL